MEFIAYTLLLFPVLLFFIAVIFTCAKAYEHIKYGNLNSQKIDDGFVQERKK